MASFSNHVSKYPGSVKDNFLTKPTAKLLKKDTVRGTVWLF
jgi:hypothetical protein